MIYGEQTGNHGVKLTHEVTDQNGDRHQFYSGDLQDHKFMKMRVRDVDKSFHDLYNGEFFDKISEPKLLDNGNVSVDDFCIQFKRTLRLPNNGKNYQLPSDFGNFELHEYNGNYYLGLENHEAMQLRFNGASKVALKIILDGINVVTGKQDQPGVLTQDPQNYICVDLQNWFDGISVQNEGDISLVRQFVPIPICQETPIMEQLKSLNLYSDATQELKFEFFYKSHSCKVFSSELGQYLDPDACPADYGLHVGSTILFESYENRNKNKITLRDLGIRDGAKIFVEKYSEDNFPIHIKTTTRNMIDINIGKNTSIKTLKKNIKMINGISICCIKLRFNGVELEDEMIVQQCSIRPHDVLHLVEKNCTDSVVKRPQTTRTMGSQIVQPIYQDTRQIDGYMKWCKTFTMKVCNLLAYPFKILESPITHKSYMFNGVPCLGLFRDREAIELAKTKFFLENKFFDEHDKCCICMENYANTRLKPCGHQLCQNCLRQISEKKKFKRHPCQHKINLDRVEILLPLIDLQNGNGHITVIEDCNNKFLISSSRKSVGYLLKKIKPHFI